MSITGNTNGPDSGPSRRHDLMAFLAILACVAVLYATAPKGGAFWWSDAPRHALNGAFVMDFIKAMPWDDPVGYAYRYYAQYPGLTILFYPPLFYALCAPLYAIFGVTHEVALVAVMAHYLALGCGAYRLARMWLEPVAATGLAVAFLGLPEMAFWGRQIMLDVPAYAFVVWSAVHFVRHLRHGHRRHLAWAAALLVLGMYTKITVGFIALPYVLALLVNRGWRPVVGDKSIWLVAALGLMAIIPLVALTIMFGQANVQSVAGISDRLVARDTPAAWVWYAKKFPLQLGWATFFILGLVMAVAARQWWRQGFPLMDAAKSPRAETLLASRAEHALMVAWLVVGYLFFTAIDLKEVRHSIYLLLPVMYWPLMVLASSTMRRHAALATAALAIASWSWTLAKRPTPYVDGYAAVVRYLAEHAPQNSAVLFHGLRDGAFTFNVRAVESRRDLSVIRGDKMLVRAGIRRSLGAEERRFTDDELVDRINRSAVHYLVVQPGFWSGLAVMRQFEAVLAERPQFQEVARFELPRSHLTLEHTLVVYRNSGAAATADPYVIELPTIGRTIEAGGRR